MGIDDRDADRGSGLQSQLAGCCCRQSVADWLAHGPDTSADSTKALDRKIAQADRSEESGIPPRAIQPPVLHIGPLADRGAE